MEMEKRRSKGSFLSLFDWNSKSRKKLVWSDPGIINVHFCCHCLHSMYTYWLNSEYFSSMLLSLSLVCLF